MTTFPKNIFLNITTYQDFSRSLYLVTLEMSLDPLIEGFKLVNLEVNIDSFIKQRSEKSIICL